MGGLQLCGAAFFDVAVGSFMWSKKCEPGRARGRRGFGHDLLATDRRIRDPPKNSGIRKSGFQDFGRILSQWGCVYKFAAPRFSTSPSAVFRGGSAKNGVRNLRDEVGQQGPRLRWRSGGRVYDFRSTGGLAISSRQTLQPRYFEFEDTA